MPELTVKEDTQKTQLQKNEYIKLFLVSCDQILIWKVFLFRVLKRVELSYNMVVHIQCGSTLQVLKVLFIHTSFSTGGSTCVFFNLALLLFFFFPSRTDPSSFCVPFFSKYESDELEKSTYPDYDSDSDVPEELKQDYVDEQTGDVPLKRSVAHRTHRGTASGVSQ